MMISYEHWVQFRGKKLGLVWQTDDGTSEVEGDTDCVLVDDGRIVSVRSPDEFAMVTHRYRLTVEQAPDDVQNLDGLEQLLELPASDATCEQVLNGWNLFNDIARSVGASLDDGGPEASKCYDKLFYGMNLESITPAGEHYSPEFAHEECLLIAEILIRGRTILAARIGPSAR